MLTECKFNPIAIQGKSTTKKKKRKIDIPRSFPTQRNVSTKRDEQIHELNPSNNSEYTKFVDKFQHLNHYPLHRNTRGN